MAKVEDSTIAVTGSIKSSQPASTPAPSATHDPALAEYRLERFMSDNTTTIPPFHPATSEEEIIQVAKERAMENVRAVDQVLGESTENEVKKT